MPYYLVSFRDQQKKRRKQSILQESTDSAEKEIKSLFPGSEIINVVRDSGFETVKGQQAPLHSQ